MDLVSSLATPMSHATSKVIGTSDEVAALLPPDWPLDVPLARIRTCGTLFVEVLISLNHSPDGSQQAIYGPPTASLLEIKGMTTSFLLLALLASQPNCCAAKDFLIQTLPHLRHPHTTDEEDDLEEDGALKRLDNVVSLLRKLLYPPMLLDLPGANTLRKRLVRYVRATPDSGPGYRLAGFPLLWLDIEAMETATTRARLLEEHGEDGLQEWQRAYQIGMRGSFLAHEPYSDWAGWRRARVADLLWQSVHAQWKRAALREDGVSGKEAAIRLLLDFWQGHMSNEDAFRSLIEMLGHQERFQLVEECYRQLCVALDREGRMPHKRTQEKIEFVRTLQVQGEHHWQIAKLSSATSDSLIVDRTVIGGEASPEQILQETRHLIGREAWLAGVHQMVQAFPTKKLIILQGPIGIGKSSELTRLARSFQRASYHIIWLPLLTAEWSSGPGVALNVLIGTLLSEFGIGPFPADTPRERLITTFLTHLGQQNRPTVMLFDNAECLLEENGMLAGCWEAFLVQFVRHRHQATILLATKEWHGWPGRESIFVAETFIPPLTQDESVCLLQRLGLEGVPIEQLQAVSVRVTGIPLLLEWTAKLVADPLLLDNWESFNENESILQPYIAQESLAARLQKVLDDPSLLGEHLANRLAPLLRRILENHLSEEARFVLTQLACATIPLGKPALQLLCPRPRLLKELRDASLLAAYTNRIQLLPMVAVTVRQYLDSEQEYTGEEIVIKALARWLDDGNLSDQEAGHVVTELVVLLLVHHRLLDAAQFLICYGWLSFKLGNAPRLALFAEKVKNQFDWQASLENTIGGKLLYYFLTPYLGKQIDGEQRREDYSTILDAVFTEKIGINPQVEIFLTHYLLMKKLDELRFEEAHELLLTSSRHMEDLQDMQIDVHAALLEKQGMVVSRWCEYAEEQGEKTNAQVLRERAIAIYYQSIRMLTNYVDVSPLKNSRLKRWQAHALNFLGYHLYRMGRYEEALSTLMQSTLLQEKGYAARAGLPPCYGDISLTLTALGRFQEALQFDKKAALEAKRVAELGHAASQEEIWIYQVNRGCLYLRLGRINEAEQLLREALPHISAHRRMYRMFAKEALEEIEQWRRTSISPQHQLDWRWVERYRALASFDSYWWLASAGSFTHEEQQEWEQFFTHTPDEITKERLGTLMSRSTRREVQAAIAEQREPRLYHPVLPIEAVRMHIVELVQLDTEITQEEPNAIVRRLYHETIEEEIDYLRLIEATYEKKNERFWEYNIRTIPTATPEEMQYALQGVRWQIIQGLQHPETAQASEQLISILRERCGISFDLSCAEEDVDKLHNSVSPASPQQPHMVSVRATKQFFEAVLQQSGFDGWHVVIDPTAGGARVEQALRCLFLPDRSVSIVQIKHLLAHELACHAARCVAGERSLLGLLGIHTKNSLETEEGIAAYYDMQEERQQQDGQHHSKVWLGTLATGFASGVVTPPQAFMSLFAFFEAFFFLRRLLQGLDPDKEIAKEKARQAAITRCLRTYRGVPDLEYAGICFTQDAIYLRGLWTIERAYKEDEHVFDRLAVGVVAVEQLPDLQELGIISAPQPIRTLLEDPQLDTYIRSFEDEK